MYCSNTNDSYKQTHWLLPSKPVNKVNSTEGLLLKILFASRLISHWIHLKLILACIECVLRFKIEMNSSPKLVKQLILFIPLSKESYDENVKFV